MALTITTDDVALILNAIVEGANQYDGNGEVGAADITLAQMLRIMFANSGATNASNLNTDNGQCVVKSVGGGRNRTVVTLINGNRTVTSRDGS